MLILKVLITRNILLVKVAKKSRQASGLVDLMIGRRQEI